MAATTMQRTHSPAHDDLPAADERDSTIAEIGCAVPTPLGRIALRAQLLQRRLAAQGADPEVLADLEFIDAASLAIAQQIDHLLHLASNGVPVDVAAT
jgi:hypothetical protein